MNEIRSKYDFVLLFDVQDGNPNGDPDAGNLPRIDPETGQGLVSDVCLKRKLRNYVLLTKQGVDGYDVFVKEKAVLNRLIDEAYEGDDVKRQPKGAGQVDAAQKAMCRRFFDVRTFGAVMSTGKNAGQVRGPVQLTFSRSIDPVVPLEHSITRMAVATEEEAAKQQGGNRTMGRKATIPYGLYCCHGFVSAALARQTGFSEEDLSLVWDGLKNMFGEDHSAARGLMSTRKLFVFKHQSDLGSAPAHRLFDLVAVKRKDQTKPPRAFSDYEVRLEGETPPGVEVVEML
jgi:CRISPR-associated protein Csd2